MIHSLKNAAIVVILLLGLCKPEVTTAQHTFSRLKIEHWDTRKGMPNDMALNVYQTKEGYIWTTGYTGLVRFDGISFTSFNSRSVPLLKSDNVEGLLYETNDSTLWIPTPNSGLVSYEKGEFKAYLTDSTILYILGKTKNEELILSFGRGILSYGLFNTHTRAFQSISDSQRIQLLTNDGLISHSYARDKSGNLWGSLNRKFFRFNGGKFFEITAKEGILSDRVYYETYADSRNRVWLVSSKGLFLWNGKAFELYPGMEAALFTSSSPSTTMILEDRKGGIWAATSSGVAYLPAGSDRFEFFSVNESMLSQNMNNIMEDREGNIWFSSTANGLFKLSESKFNNYSVRDGLNDNRIAAVCAIDNNTYLVATYRKLFRISNGVVEPYPFKNKSLENFRGDPTHLYKDTRGNIWICFSSGNIIRISEKGEKLFEAKGFVQARYVFEDDKGQIWFGFGYTGIGFLNAKDNIELLPLPKVDFSSLYLGTIRKLSNGKWLLTSFNKGVLVIDTSGNPTYYDDKSGLPTIGVFSSLEDPDGTIWLTTQSGITRLKNGEFLHIGFREGLPENSVFEFMPDHEGYVWFPSNRGLIRAKKQELNDFLDKKTAAINWSLYDDGDGMFNRQCVGARHPSITPNGRLLFPTFGGLVEVNPGQLQKNTFPPPVNIHQVSRDDVDLGLLQNRLFSPGNHRYIFSYSALSFVAPEKIQFKFKLEGYDNDWIIAVGDRKAIYTNIPSGKYTFRVIASNNDGIWNTTGASYAFTVKPFFYETTWFRILVLVAFLFLIAQIIKWRTRVTRKQNEMLEAEIASRTSQLHQSNAELNQSLENLKATQHQLIQSEKMASLGELTAGIAHEIQNPLNFVNNFAEVNKEMLAEMREELEKKNFDVAISLAKDVEDNEEKIIFHGKRADAIVKGMLQHSRSSSGIKEPTDINALADEYLRLAYHGLRAKDKNFNATLKTDFDPGIGTIPVIPQDIGRVILNLITNAFYVVDQKKKETQARDGENAYEPIVTVSTRKTGDQVEISVADNGNGIPDSIKEKIFQPFFTTKPTGQGTGLGLSMSYDIVTKSHKGELKVETAVNQGTTFTIILPIQHPV
ncbi:MAG: hypothetical protein GC171_03875 [Terrimonas sp.]|nr:hypothetical protein [Terrimonas sp.]